MICIHYRIQVRVPHLCNSLVEIYNLWSLLNNNINDVIQYTYIDYDTINTARHTDTSTSKESSTSITGTIQDINNTVITTNTTTG